MNPKFAQYMVGKSDMLLIGALRLVDAKPNPDEYERMTRAALIEELENRHPEASAAVEAAFDSAELRAMEAADFGHPVEDIDYVAVLLANILA